jgi:alpha-L-rhamnosidase
MTSISNLICEYRPNPLGIDVTAPRLGWQMQSDRRGARQKAAIRFPGGLTAT